jgi:hypothetical protein
MADGKLYRNTETGRNVPLRTRTSYRGYGNCFESKRVVQKNRKIKSALPDRGKQVEPPRGVRCR